MSARQVGRGWRRGGSFRGFGRGPEAGGLPRRRKSGGGRGFSLVELLIVILIVTVVISIIVPALGLARRAARTATTQQLLTQITGAIGTFQQDNAGKEPGYYSVREMGGDENEDAGLSAMENILLDLSGGIVDKDGPLDVPSVVKINPTDDPDREVVVDPDLIGVERAGSKAYFIPDGKFYVPQVKGTQQVVATNGPAAPEGEPQLPDVVDAWGNPLLAWVRNPVGPTTICQSGMPADLDCFERFARRSSDDGSSLFYWNSNAAFLRAPATGKSAANQAKDSLLGAETDDELLSFTMAGLLGSPSFPHDRDNEGEVIVPKRARGSVVVQSAGGDGLFLGKNDKTGKQVVHYESAGDVDTGHLVYGVNLKISSESDEDRLDDKGQVDTIDILDKFDDLVLRVD